LTKKLEVWVREFFDIDKRVYFLFLCLITFLVLLIKKNFVENETAAFEVLEMRGQEGIFQVFNTLQYITIPLFYLWKFTVIAFLLWMGSFAFGYKIPFKKCWQVAMIAETIFILPELMKIAHFALGPDDPNFYDIKAYFPFSLMNLYNYQDVATKYHYPLKALNLFEILYWGLLVYGLHLAAKKEFRVAFASVSASYILFFFLWLWFYISVYK
jgi:hypothetical protein